MKRLLMLFSILGLSGTAFAQIELHSMRCLSKDLTLEAYVKKSPEVADFDLPNANGVLKFTALTEKGKALLGNRTEVVKAQDFALELWATGNYLISYSENGQAFLYMDTREELDLYLDALQPNLYFYQGPQKGVNGMTSFIQGQRFEWESCELSDEQLACPAEDSSQEKDLILTAGPEMLNTGKSNMCLVQILDRETSVLGKKLEKMSTQELANFLSQLMAATIKAEAFEKAQ